MELGISIAALLVAIGSLYIQRKHNAKSLKPLGQIDLVDKKGIIYIYIQNNGVGPLIIDKLTFSKNGEHYSSISDCLNIEPETYWYIPINGQSIKSIVPNSSFKVFEKNTQETSPEKLENIKQQLAAIKLKVDYKDIYDNKYMMERKLEWFARRIR